jgi:predicted signal transduction protein with EAL and GGDEF domain
MLIWLTSIAIIFFVLLLVIIWKLNQNGIHDNTMFAILIALYFIGVFIVIVTVLLTLRSFVKPMRQITENALKLAEGNYDIELDCEIYDIDWHLLIQMFNQMSEEIHRKIDQFNTQNELLITQKSEIEELNERLKAKVELKSKKLNEYINIIDKYIITSQTDIHGVITYASDAFCRISGYTYQVADILKVYTSRSGEYAFRLGGEEFGVLVSEMSQEEYLNLGNLIRREIEALAITHKKNNASPYVTISMGIVLYHPDSTLTYEELYKAADNQLYMAKDKGRNQVMMKSF